MWANVWSVTQEMGPTIQGKSPSILQTILSRSLLGTTFRCCLIHSRVIRRKLICIDTFSGYIIAKAGISRTAQTVDGNYGKCVFLHFEVNKTIRHDRKPGFMSDIFRAFNGSWVRDNEIDGI